MSAVLVAEGVEVVLGGRTILHDVSVSVHAGEVVVLVGPNGAGKSTLFGTLAGDIAPRRGRVLVADEPDPVDAARSGTPDLVPLSSVRPRDLARRRAVQTQESRLSFAFTARDTVEMGRAPWAGTERELLDDEAVDRAMRRSDTGHLATRQVPVLSGGERARVAFARLLAQETPIVLLDEPTAALDIHHQEEVMRVVRELADDGAAVLVIVHDLSLAAAHADRIVLLAEGTIRADGPPREVLRGDLLSRVYGHPIEVFERPGSDELLVAPARARSRPRPSADPIRPTHLLASSETAR